ncbi:Glycoside hydrolase superfamily [Penicillium hordei]|uniref:Glycoside hydrolase superfamily n=1 Tax=Penicillium hordei TaxID=40994 RepID=A0AAD6GSD0_9EURO|nr:Glycoside hydrolase superfamily [Penicillium hordei]KAJ5589426.1 Glycoside hydrolase superfamily [Penicillium hordei]
MSKYKGNFSHIHFTSANITADMKVDVEDIKFSFNAFVKLEGSKCILSFDAIEAAEMQKVIDAADQIRRQRRNP